jgi:hypothetical protein
MTCDERRGGIERQARDDAGNATLRRGNRDEARPHRTLAARCTFGGEGIEKPPRVAGQGIAYRGIAGGGIG